ncbi:MAG: hypothetical protein DRI71_08485 [Bacteroidetes bacterium]|nr:MAG: hypothetical protein DRI71_08485 [Bacteroidota bacterium]
MKKLKRIFLGGIAMLISLGVSAGSLSNFTNPEKDTVILKFGNNSQIVIYVDNKEDLEELTQYDINKILEDLNLEVNNLSDSVQVLEIKDETGEKYLKDTTVVYKVEPTTTWEDNDEDKKRYRYYPRSRFDFVFDVGLNNYLEDGKFPVGSKPYSLMPLGSWYWNLGPSYKVHLFGPVFVDMAITAALNVYRFDDARSRFSADENGVNFYLDSANVSYKKSKLSTWHLQGKIVPMFAFGSNHRRGWRLWNNIDKGFRIGAGVYGGYRIWSRTKYKYDDNKDKNTSNHLLNNVRYGVRGQVGFRGIDLFVEYDLSEMFQENQGAPQLNRIQFGVTF